jgi:hypothetical protein
MSQEDAEKEISFDCLRTIVDETIKTKNICTIERLEVTEKQLRYMQKYAELQISKNEFETGNIGIGLAFFAIGISFIVLTADFSNKISSIEGVIFSILGLVIIFWKTPKVKKNEFIHKIILKIEEKLPDKS